MSWLGRLGTQIGGLHGDRTPRSCCAGLSSCRLSPNVAHGPENKQCRNTMQSITSGRKRGAQECPHTAGPLAWGCGPTVQWSQRAAWSGDGWSGVHASVGAADLQLVLSHRLLSHPDCLERGGRWWKTLLGDHASQRGWATTVLTPHGLTQHRQGPLIFPRKTASLCWKWRAPHSVQVLGGVLQPQGHGQMV